MMIHRPRTANAQPSDPFSPGKRSLEFSDALGDPFHDRLWTLVRACRHSTAIDNPIDRIDQAESELGGP
jgi:hypothetical protein